jgi:hypothetical protein
MLQSFNHFVKEEIADVNSCLYHLAQSGKYPYDLYGADLCGSQPSLTSGPWLYLFDVLRWPVDGDPATFSADTRAVNAVLGGVMVGWGLLMFFLSQRKYMTAIKELPRLMMTALLAWFVVDCSGSLLAGLPGNLVLNVLFLVMFIPPLLVLSRETMRRF